MGEFEKAERTDRELDRAWEEDLRRDDWDELHGEWVNRPTCPRCRGKGYVILDGPDENGLYDADDCPECQGPLHG